MSGFDAPQSRNEAILQNILGANNELAPTQSRIEALLKQILESGGAIMTPITTAEIIEIIDSIR